MVFEISDINLLIIVVCIVMAMVIIDMIVAHRYISEYRELKKMLQEMQNKNV